MIALKADEPFTVLLFSELCIMLLLFLMSFGCMEVTIYETVSLHRYSNVIPTYSCKIGIIHISLPIRRI